jgi:hypothetical protein
MPAEIRAAVQWCDSGRNIPETDEAPALIRHLEARLRELNFR